MIEKSAIEKIGDFVQDEQIAKFMEEEKPFEPFFYLQNDQERDSIIKFIKKCHKTKPTKENAKLYIEMLRSGERLTMLDAGIKLRELCDNLPDLRFEPIFDEIRDKDLIRDLLDLVRTSEEDYLRADLARVIGNLFYKSKGKVEEFTKNGIIEVYGGILESESLNLKLADKLLLAVGNICWYQPKSIPKFLAQNLINSLKNLHLRVFREVDLPIHPLICRLMWVISLMLQEELGEENVKKLIPMVKKTFKRIIKAQKYPSEHLGDTLRHCINAFVNSCNLNQVPQIFELEITKDLLHLLHAEINPKLRETILESTVKVLNYFVYNEGDSFDSVMEHGIVDHMLFLLEHCKDSAVKEEACFCLANIALSSPEQSQVIIDNKALLSVLMVIATEGEVDVRKNAVKTLTNLTYEATDGQIGYLLRENILELYCNILGMKREMRQEEDIAWLTIESIGFVLDQVTRMLGLKRGELNPICERIERVGLKKRIAEVREESKGVVAGAYVKIWKVAGEILDDYFGDSEGDDRSYDEDDLSD